MMKPTVKIWTAAASAILLIAGAAARHACAAAELVLQPDEPQSKDAWAYQFLATTDVNVDFFGILCAGYTGAGSSHSQQTFIQFDLTSIALPFTKVASATLSLHTFDGTTPFGVSPSAQYNLDVSVYPATTSWDEALTWNTRPAVSSPAADTVTLDGTNLNSWVSFDITSLVKQWLAAPLSNNGVGVLADEEVRDATNSAVIGVFDSASSEHKPSVTIEFSAIAGDATLDDAVDIDDLYVLAGNWQRSGDADWSHGDFDGDHSVTATDLGLLATNWQAGAQDFGQSAAALGLPVVAPEPAAGIGLLVWAGICGMIRRDRRV